MKAIERNAVLDALHEKKKVYILIEVTGQTTIEEFFAAQGYCMEDEATPPPRCEEGVRTQL